MATCTISFDLPEELVNQLGPRDSLVATAKEAFVLHLLREAEISQGQAAKLLGITRWDLFDLMAKYDIPSGPQTADEMRRDVENLRRHLSESDARASR